jgi:uncharacterized protein YaiI (UPF0178 family)
LLIVKGKVKEPIDLRIIVDADACPRVAKEILYKTANRLEIELVLVANQRLFIPASHFIRTIVVDAGADVADDHIVKIVEKHDLVISADIPLADRVIKKGAVVIDPRGQLLTNENIGDKLATRDLMDELRSTGMVTGGPAGYGKKEKQEFANQLDKYLVRAIRLYHSQSKK